MIDIEVHIGAVVDGRSGSISAIVMCLCDDVASFHLYG